MQEPASRAVWEEDPEFMPDTAWARWMETQVENAELSATALADKFGIPPEGVFAVARSPHDSRSYAFTFAPPTDHSDQDAVFREEVAPSRRLVKVCPVPFLNADLGQYESSVLPRVLEIQRSQAAINGRSGEWIEKQRWDAYLKGQPFIAIVSGALWQPFAPRTEAMEIALQAKALMGNTAQAR